MLISAGNEEPEAFFELSSKDIILFKRHPEAISASNLLAWHRSKHLPSRQ